MLFEFYMGHSSPPPPPPASPLPGPNKAQEESKKQKLA